MQMIRPARRVAGATTAVLVAAGLATSAGAGAAATRPSGDHTTTTRAPSLTAAQRQVIRAATSRFRDVGVALSAGYRPVSECVADPVLGGMGVHLANPARNADDAIDPTLPEALVYAPTPAGRLRLAAIEYVKNDADGDLDTDADRPSLFGVPFDGPMLGHTPDQPVHYDIHAWVWMQNPAGDLAQFNPHVTCPETER